MKSKSLAIHYTIGWLCVIGTLAMVGFWVPPEEKELGNSYLIFFWHFPSAINCMNIFMIAGVNCALYLWKGRKSSSDLWTVAAIEVGLLACSVTLVTGFIWARAAWGEWGTWMFADPRLLSVYIMWFTYAAYLAFRGSIDDPRKRQIFCAAFGLIATINVPIVYFAIRVFGSESHPMQMTAKDSSIVVTRWFGAAAFLVLYLAMMRHRRRIYENRARLDRLEGAFSRVEI